MTSCLISFLILLPLMAGTVPTWSHIFAAVRWFVCVFVSSSRGLTKKGKKKAIEWIFTTRPGPNRTISVLSRIQKAERIQSCLIDVLNTARVSFSIQSMFWGNSDQQHDVRQPPLRLQSARCELFRAHQKKKKKDPTKASLCMKKKFWLSCCETTIKNLQLLPIQSKMKIKQKMRNKHNLRLFAGISNMAILQQTPFNRLIQK